MERVLLVGLVIDILRSSDIVWPRYGSDSIQDLAERIVLELERANKNN